MTENLIIAGKNYTGRVRHKTSTAYLPVHDHKRLPGAVFCTSEAFGRVSRGLIARCQTVLITVSHSDEIHDRTKNSV